MHDDQCCCDDWDIIDTNLARAECNDCGRTWYITAEQIKATEERQREIDAAEAEMERRQWTQEDIAAAEKSGAERAAAIKWDDTDV